jgi:hypothetical protein
MEGTDNAALIDSRGRSPRTNGLATPPAGVSPHAVQALDGGPGPPGRDSVPFS